MPCTTAAQRLTVCTSTAGANFVTATATIAVIVAAAALAS